MYCKRLRGMTPKASHMKVFMSYARFDEVVVEKLRRDLQVLADDVWIDDRLAGGQVWWDEILSQIRTCDVFVLALSDRSVASHYCKTELQYARDLRRSILTVQVRRLRTSPAVPIDLQRR